MNAFKHQRQIIIVYRNKSVKFSFNDTSPRFDCALQSSEHVQLLTEVFFARLRLTLKRYNEHVPILIFRCLKQPLLFVLSSKFLSSFQDAGMNKIALTAINMWISFATNFY